MSVPDNDNAVERQTGKAARFRLAVANRILGLLGTMSVARHLESRRGAWAREPMIVRLRQAGLERVLASMERPSLAHRILAAALSGLAGRPDCIPRLSAMLEAEDDEMHLVGAVGLAYARDRRGLATLAEALQHPDPGIRRIAAGALRELRAAAGHALPALHECLTREKNRRVRPALRDAIEHIQAAVRSGPAELEAAPMVAGRGTEPEAAPPPAGRGTEPEAMETRA